MMDREDDEEQSPPPTPGPSSFAPNMATINRAPPRSLSLQIPRDDANATAVGRRRRPSHLNLSESATSTQLASPLPGDSQLSSASEAARHHLSSTLRGTPRRRPSMPFKKPQLATESDLSADTSSSTLQRPPEAFRDPSEHILSGKGSTLQHARSVYSQGPVEVLPGLYLGDEHNACDNQMLSHLGITTILNVSKETVLPFQVQLTEAVQPTSAAAKPQDVWPPRRPGSAVRSTSLLSGVPYSDTAAQADSFYTPPTTALPKSAELDKIQELDSPMVSMGTSILRNTSSTPNLLTHFLNDGDGAAKTAAAAVAQVQYTAEDVMQYRNLRRESSSSSDDAFGTSPGSSRAASTCTSATTDLTGPVRDTSGTVGDQTSDDGISKVHLPSNATVLRVPVGATEMRYIKLPWTHDETNLSAHEGGFTQGCALIAEVLGLDPRVWVAANIADQPASYNLLSGRDNLGQIQTGASGGKVLVHCQCGVSRSATLVIAFVMQAAALRFGYTETDSLMGMHDCYNMVKEKSASISPNISLIYQLVEWERHLSHAASRLRDIQGSDTHGSQHNTASGAPGWSTETMDEAMWSKMRLEEEEKEAAEDARRQSERLAQLSQPVERRTSEMDSSITDPTASGSLLQRRRKKAAPALQLHTVETTRKPPALQLNPETPFYTARASDDVDMEDVDQPITPLPSTKSHLDPACTPTASQSTKPLLHTPLSAIPLPSATTASLQHFSFGGAKSSVPNTASTSSSSSGGAAWFGVHAISREERRKQHRRTFSSDWPTLQPGSHIPAPPRRGSKLADSIGFPMPSDTAMEDE